MARKRLEQLVNSGDDRLALRASTALYSYGPERPAGEDQKTGTLERGYALAPIQKLMRQLEEFGLAKVSFDADGFTYALLDLQQLRAQVDQAWLGPIENLGRWQAWMLEGIPEDEFDEMDLEILRRGSRLLRGEEQEPAGEAPAVEAAPRGGSKRGTC